MSHKSRRYANELTNAQWKNLAAILPNRSGQAGRPMELDLLAVMNAIFYPVRTGCQWKNLPREYPNYKSVYYHYRKWCLDGTWERVNRALVYLERKRQGRLLHPSAALIDSQSSKTTESGGEHSYDGGKKISGRNRHIMTDTFEILLGLSVRRELRTVKAQNKFSIPASQVAKPFASRLGRWRL